MDKSERAVLKAAVIASQDAAIQAAAAARNDTELERLLNLKSTFVVWRSATPTSEIVDAVTWASLTPADTPDGTATYTNRALACQSRQINLQVMLQGRDSLPTGRINIRQALSDALQGVPAGAGGATLDAGWAGASRVKATISRTATVAERAFVTGTGSSAVPGNLGWEGNVNINDIGAMWSD